MLSSDFSWIVAHPVWPESVLHDDVDMVSVKPKLTQPYGQIELLLKVNQSIRKVRHGAISQVFDQLTLFLRTHRSGVIS